MLKTPFECSKLEAITYALVNTNDTLIQITSMKKQRNVVLYAHHYFNEFNETIFNHLLQNDVNYTFNYVEPLLMNMTIEDYRKTIRGFILKTGANLFVKKIIDIRNDIDPLVLYMIPECNTKPTKMNNILFNGHDVCNSASTNASLIKRDNLDTIKHDPIVFINHIEYYNIYVELDMPLEEYMDSYFSECDKTYVNIATRFMYHLDLPSFEKLDIAANKHLNKKALKWFNKVKN